jgi:Cd2+/Zn2+-exporting ATPase
MFAFLVIDESFSKSFYRAMAVLVSASPCALAISTPSAVLAGIARGAKGGVLIKGGKPLEELGTIDAIAFDKTGTLTEGKPKLTHIIPHDGISELELIATSAAVEALSDHPLAEAIVVGCEAKLSPGEFKTADNLKALTARGVVAEVENKKVYIGNRLLMEEVTGAKIPPELDENMHMLEESGNTSMLVLKEKEYLGIIAVMDVARKEVKETLAKLKQLGIQKMIMLTGDHQNVADSIAKDIGITDPLGNLLPEDKVKAIKELSDNGLKVAMVGDGVNDAPAMATSHIGIAMGAAGSAVALETADVALMADRLDKLPFSIRLSRQTNKIIKQNLWISLGMVAILVPLTISGIASIGPAVVAHEGSTLVVVLNALRLLGTKD